MAYFVCRGSMDHDIKTDTGVNIQLSLVLVIRDESSLWCISGGLDHKI